MTKKTIGIFLGIASFLIILFFTDLKPGHPEITRTAAVAALMAIWWVTEAAPLAITALIPLVAFPALGVIDGKVISESYVNHIIFLFIGGFMMALAMERWNLHKRIALTILKFAGVSPGRILFGFMFSALILSMWISNTATTMMMIPIVTSIIFELEENVGKKKISRYSIGLLLGVAYSASIGGNATLVGTPTNLICVRILNVLYPAAPEITFTQWLLFALPISIIMFVVAYGLLFLIFRPKEKWSAISVDTFQRQLNALGKPSYEEKVVFALFLTLAVLWISRSGFNIGAAQVPGWAQIFEIPAFMNDGTSAIFITILLFVWPSKSAGSARIMNWKTATKLPWNIVLLFGGGFALAKGFEQSGLALWFGEQLAWGSQIPSIVFVLAIVALMSFLTELTSNVASTQMLLPAFAAIAVATGDNPLLFMVPATIASSLAFMLPTATPSNAIVFGSDRITIADMIKTGFRLNLIGIMVITFLTYFLIGEMFGVVINEVPAWAK